LSTHPKIERTADLAKNKIIARLLRKSISWELSAVKGSSILVRGNSRTPRWVNSVSLAPLPHRRKGAAITRLSFLPHPRPEPRSQATNCNPSGARRTLRGGPCIYSPQGRLCRSKVRAFRWISPCVRLKAHLSRPVCNAASGNKRGIPTASRKVFFRLAGIGDVRSSTPPRTNRHRTAKRSNP